MEADKFLKNTMAGAIAGLAATWVMTKAQNSMQSLRSSDESKDEEAQGSSEEPATVKLANRVSNTLLHHPVPEDKKHTAGNLVHYGFGASLGALYAFFNADKEKNSYLSGALYGALVWMVADNIVVPLLKLSAPPTEHGLKDHAYALGSHLVYGTSLKRLSKPLIAKAS